MNADVEQKVWIGSKGAAAYLGCSRRTLYRAIQSGRLAAGRTPGGHYRFHRRDLDAFLTRQKET